MADELLTLFGDPAWADAHAASAIKQKFFDRWIRHGIIAGLGVGFSVPYFRLLNRIHVKGDRLLHRLPKKNVVFLSNHQTYFMEAIAFFDVVYVRRGFPLENPFLRFSAAEETMKKNFLISFLKKAGGVTLKRSFREGGVTINRAVDVEGASRVEEAIASGWLLHFPAGTTQRGAPLRPGVAQILHRTRALAVPVRVDGFRDLLLHRQLPGRVFQRCSLTIHPPLDLEKFYAAPYTKETGQKVLDEITRFIGDPDDHGSPHERPHHRHASQTPDK